MYKYSKTTVFGAFAGFIMIGSAFAAETSDALEGMENDQKILAIPSVEATLEKKKAEQVVSVEQLSGHIGAKEQKKAEDIEAEKLKKLKPDAAVGIYMPVDYSVFDESTTPEIAEALRLWMEGNDDKALPLFEELLEKAPENPIPAYILTISAMGGQYDAEKLNGRLVNRFLAQTKTQKGNSYFYPHADAIKQAAEEFALPRAQFLYGHIGTFKDWLNTTMTTEAEWIAKAAREKEPIALAFVGASYYPGTIIQMPAIVNSKTATRYLKKAVDMGSPYAMTVLGYTYVTGIESAKGVNLYKRAADLGYVPAMYHYGDALVKGVGIKKDVKTGIEWLQKAAERGSIFASDELAGIYKAGKLVPADKVLADKYTVMKYKYPAIMNARDKKVLTLQ